VEDNENACTLDFGEVDFEQLEVLTNDEVFLLLGRRLEEGVTNDLLQQTYAYVERVASTKINTSIEHLTMEMREILGDIKLRKTSGGNPEPLHKFEACCLANFIRDDDSSVQEVLSLLPSMAIYALDDIEMVIGKIMAVKEKYAGDL